MGVPGSNTLGLKQISTVQRKRRGPRSGTESVLFISKETYYVVGILIRKYKKSALEDVGVDNCKNPINNNRLKNERARYPVGTLFLYRNVEKVALFKEYHIDTVEDS